VRPAALAMLAAAALLAGCGGGDRPQLTVFGATSLKTAFTSYGDSFEDASVRYSFAGSDELAAQIRQGSTPDVYAAANTRLPAQLYAKKLVDRPVVFTTNRLVLAVPAGSSKVRSVADLTKPGTKVAIGSATVPIGSYTRQVLARLGPARSAGVLKNVKSEEPDVGGIVGKLTQGAVDAGFVYATDVKAAKGKLTAVALPASVQPVVDYGVAVIHATKHRKQAQAFVDGLLSGRGRQALLQAGFGARKLRAAGGG
jgi:molybdate transport system substrate-binding protein